MKSCLECKNYEGCKAPCAEVEAHVSEGYVGHGKSSVYIQGPGFDNAGGVDWIDWIYISEGADWPASPIDFNDLGVLDREIFSEIQVRAVTDRFVEGMLLKDIAKKEGVSIAAITDRLRSCGKALKRYVKCRGVWEKIKWAMPLYSSTKMKIAYLRYHEGLSCLRVAKIMGVSDTNIRYHLKSMGV